MSWRDKIKGVSSNSASSAGNAPRGKRSAVQSRAAGANVRSVTYSTSPLLASKTPPWRSKFLVAVVGLSFCGLLGRALYVQVIGAEFFQRQGEIRYARTLELCRPAAGASSIATV